MSTPIPISRITNLKIENRPVFMRLDFNVPLGKPSGGIRTIENDNRIREALPTIEYAISKGAKLILASHLGQPKSKTPDLSLEPVATRLAELLKKDVTLADDCIGEGIELKAQNMGQGDVLLLENLRFHQGEEKNDPEFYRKLSRLAPVFVTDAFGTCHRKHASTYGLPSIAQEKGMGYLIEKELKFLDRLLQNPITPYYLILGGAKVGDKIKTIESLLPRVQGIAIGGAMAFAFMAASAKTLPEGAKTPSPEDIECAKKVLTQAKSRQVQILLPEDFKEAFDIGPKTIQTFSKFLSNAKSLFWNGPLGWFEKPEYSEGTFAIARAISQTRALKVVGGGDTVSAVQQSGHAKEFDHLSTGGGAVLEYLEGNSLPGIEILRQ